MNDSRYVFAICRAETSDLAAMMRIYARARSFMADHGNPNQWKDGWPSEERIRQDIELGKSYICLYNGKTAAVFYYDYGSDPEPDYDRLAEGKWISSGPYGVVHRIASAGIVHGAAAYCLEWAFSQCRHLRIDTHPDNRVMQNLLLKLGFVQCGIIHIAREDEIRLAFEKAEMQQEE